MFFSENKEGKPVIVSVQSIYSFCNKMEEHSWKTIQNSNHIIFALLYNNLGFSVSQLFEYSSDQEWNQTLNDAYICGRQLENIYLNRRKQKMLVFIRYITYYLVFLFHK